MTRKTSAYSRKRRAPGRGTFNGAEWVNIIQRCAPYGALTEVAGFDCDTESAATKAEAMTMGALESLMAHAPPDDVERLFDVLAHAVGVAMIRALQIDADESKNPAIPILKDGTEALRRSMVRWKERGQFGLDAAGRLELPAAMDVYREILRSSSPAQMVKAADEREKIVAAAAGLENAVIGGSIYSSDLTKVIDKLKQKT